VVGSGGTSGAVLNAANERAVEAFMEGAVPFGRIAELSEAALDRVGVSPIRGVPDVLEADAEARRFVQTELGVAPAR
jgi:1-deoxy-D-xylulose-5-phosphate reductoisomerase